MGILLLIPEILLFVLGVFIARIGISRSPISQVIYGLFIVLLFIASRGITFPFSLVLWLFALAVHLAMFVTICFESSVGKKARLTNALIRTLFVAVAIVPIGYFEKIRVASPPGCTSTIKAIYRYKKDTGSWPNDLSVLVPNDTSAQDSGDTYILRNDNSIDLIRSAGPLHDTFRYTAGSQFEQDGWYYDDDGGGSGVYLGGSCVDAQ